MVIITLSLHAKRTNVLVKRRASTKIKEQGTQELSLKECQQKDKLIKLTIIGRIICERKIEIQKGLVTPTQLELRSREWVHMLKANEK